MSKLLSAKQIVQDAFRTVLAEGGQAGPETLSVLGGAFAEPVLAEFLQVWSGAVGSQWPWSILEYISRVQVARDISVAEILPDLLQLERMRFFGESGDLDLRRDGDRVYWRFIGEPDAVPQDLARFGARDFWVENPGHSGFRALEKEYYQWRGKEEKIDGAWHKAAGLAAEKLYLRQIHYLHEGRQSFVRFVTFAGREDEKHE